MKVAIVVPWRPNPSRQAAWELVRDWWTTHLPDAEIITADTPHQPFVVAAARNEGVRLAERSGADVVVVADADTIPDPTGLSEAIDAAADGKIHQPYSRFGYLRRAATERAIESRQWPTPKTNLGRVSGGVWVCTPEAWRAVGGMDERFRAWGGEDDAFLAAAQTLRGFVCHTGVGMSLWHTYGHRYLGRQHRLNVALLRRYHRARGDIAAMRKLVSEVPVDTTYLVLCAGPGKRWKGDRPKQLVKLCGEVLLHRVVRQVTELDPGARVRIAVHDTTDARFRVPGARLVKADVDPTLRGADKTTSTRRHWNTNGRTVLLLGDVFYTDIAIRQIVDHATGEWVMFGRPGPSAITGKPHNENFAVVFWPDHHEQVVAAAERLHELDRAGKAPNVSMSQWWMLMEGLSIERWNTPTSPHYIEIDDWTDDIDYLADWERWCWRWAMARKAGKPVPEHREEQ